ncbi:MAG: hypothetical protein ACOVJ8_11405 [Sediminibacterium sp.]|jgi:hypothetical membrane protein
MKTAYILLLTGLLLILVGVLLNANLVTKQMTRFIFTAGLIIELVGLVALFKKNTR